MKITIPEDWGCRLEHSNHLLALRAERFCGAIEVPGMWYDYHQKILRYFRGYEYFYTKKNVEDLMQKKVALNVFEFAVTVGKAKGITRDVIEGLWFQVFEEDIWEFTGRFSKYFLI